MNKMIINIHALMTFLFFLFMRRPGFHRVSGKGIREAFSERVSGIARELHHVKVPVKSFWGPLHVGVVLSK